jgi:hypothetical protein
MTERLNHKLDVSKIQTLEDVRNVFESLKLVANVEEDNPDYDYEVLKKYYTIPNIVEPIVINGVVVEDT